MLTLLVFLQHDDQHWDSFYYLDADKRKQLTLKKTGFVRIDDVEGKGVLFDVLDKNNHLVAKLRFILAGLMRYSFYIFEIRSIDNQRIIISSTTEITSSNMHIYDTTLNHRHEIAQLTRLSFTYSLESDLSIIDQQDLLFIIDPNIFYAALAINANTDFFYSMGKFKFIREELPIFQDTESTRPQTLQKLRKKILNLAENRGITLYAQSTDLSQEEIAAAGQLLAQQYQQQTSRDAANKGNLSKDQKLEQMIKFGGDYLLTHSQSAREEYAILQFLIEQLE
jgi:hypothetical protein